MKTSPCKRVCSDQTNPDRCISFSCDEHEKMTASELQSWLLSASDSAKPSMSVIRLITKKQNYKNMVLAAFDETEKQKVQSIRDESNAIRLKAKKAL